MNTTAKKNPMFTFEGTMTELENIAYLKPYQSLYSRGKKIFAAAVCAENGQGLLRKEFADKEEMQQWISLLNNVIHECGVPNDLVILTDGSFIRERLIKHGAHRAVDFGHTIELYDHIPSLRSDGKKDKPLLTALVETKEEAISFLKDLTERLNAN
jgi:hypothetical protein